METVTLLDEKIINRRVRIVQNLQEDTPGLKRVYIEGNEVPKQDLLKLLTRARRFDLIERYDIACETQETNIT